MWIKPIGRVSLRSGDGNRRVMRAGQNVAASTEAREGIEESLLSDQSREPLPSNWKPIPPGSPEVILMDVSKDSMDYRDISLRFQLTLPKSSILLIKQIQNPTLWRMMNLAVSVVSSFLTASVVTVLFRFSGPPISIIHKEVPQCRVVLNESMALIVQENQTFVFDLKTANHSFSDLKLQIQHESELMHAKFSVLETTLAANMTNVTRDIFKQLAGVKSDMNINLTLLMETMEKFNDKMVKFNETMGNVTDIIQTQTGSLFAAEKKPLKPLNNGSLDSCAKPQIHSTPDISWKGIAVAGMCGLVLGIAVTIPVERWCLSPYGDFTDQHQKPSVNRNNGHHSPINNQTDEAQKTVMTLCHKE